MFKDNAVAHLIQKGNIKEKIRPKLPYGHGKGQFSGETEHKTEYTGKGGIRAFGLRNPTTVNFGDNTFFETTNQQHFQNSENNQEFNKTLVLKNRIKVEANGVKLLQSKEEHSFKYSKSVSRLETFDKPYSWMKGKNEKTDLQFNDKTTSKEAFVGSFQKFEKKDQKHDDNLKSPRHIQVQGRTVYGDNHSGKSPDLSNSREMYKHIKTKGQSGHKFLDNPNLNKPTTYQEHYNDTMKVTDIKEKPHFGRDDGIRDFLYQFHQGYYHVDV